MSTDLWNTTGSLHRVVNNDILDTVPRGNRFAVGIEVGDGDGTVVQDNRIADAVRPSPGQSRGINVHPTARNVLLVNNRFSTMNDPIVCLPDSTGKYRDNLTTNTAGYSGCTDAGNNR